MKIGYIAMVLFVLMATEVIADDLDRLNIAGLRLNKAHEPQVMKPDGLLPNVGGLHLNKPLDLQVKKLVPKGKIDKVVSSFLAGV